eukprot:4046578-Amphidinium_carterae.1
MTTRTTNTTSTRQHRSYKGAAWNRMRVILQILLQGSSNKPRLGLGVRRATRVAEVLHGNRCGVDWNTLCTTMSVDTLLQGLLMR